jgi:hypothetical protein
LLIPAGAAEAEAGAEAAAAAAFLTKFNADPAFKGLSGRSSLLYQKAALCTRASLVSVVFIVSISERQNPKKTALGAPVCPTTARARARRAVRAVRACVLEGYG